MPDNSHARWAILAAASLACGCSSGGAPENVRICDGSDGVRLGMSAFADPARMMTGQQVQADNGVSYLFVDGRCHYWAQTGLWSEVREGTLDDAAEAALAAQVHYSTWFDRRGAWAAPVSDAGALVFFTPTAHHSCSFCQDTSAPSEVKDASARFSSVVSGLWTKGAPLQTGAVRVTLVRLMAPNFGSVPHFGWPLAAPIASVSIPFSVAAQNAFGAGVPVIGAEAAALRSLRTAYLDGPYQTLGILGLPIDGEADAATDLLFLRDSIPIEDGQGLVRPPK